MRAKGKRVHYKTLNDGRENIHAFVMCSCTQEENWVTQGDGYEYEGALSSRSTLLLKRSQSQAQKLSILI